MQTRLPPLLGPRDDTQTPGLIWALRGGQGQPAAAIGFDAIDPLPTGEGAWTWLHLDLVDQRAHGWASRICLLPEAAHAMLEGHDPSLALAHEAGVVHGIAADFKSDLTRQTTSIGRLHFAMNGHVLVTGRRHSLEAVDEVKRAVLAGTARPKSAFELFELVIAAFCRNTVKRLAEASRVLDTVEENLMTEGAEDERARLKGVRRLAVSLHRPMASLAALFVDDERDSWNLSEHAHAVLRRLASRLERVDREVVTVSDRARLLQDEIAAELAEESNRSLRALALMSALLLPGTLVFGIFGMNVAGLPLTVTGAGFAITLVIAAGATAVFYWLLRRAGAQMRL